MKMPLMPGHAVRDYAHTTRKLTLIFAQSLQCATTHTQPTISHLPLRKVLESAAWCSFFVTVLKIKVSDNPVSFKLWHSNLAFESCKSVDMPKKKKEWLWSLLAVSVPVDLETLSPNMLKLSNHGARFWSVVRARSQPDRGSSATKEARFVCHEVSFADGTETPLASRY